jgi:hypothetical protein
MEWQRVTVLTVHGVGKHRHDEIKHALLEHMHDSHVDIQEFNWDELVPRHDSLKSTLAETASDFARTANLGFTDAALVGHFFGKRTLALHNGCYCIAQACLAIAYTSVLVLPLLFLLGPLSFTLSTDLEWKYFESSFRWIAQSLWALVFLALISIGLELLLALVGSWPHAPLMTFRRIMVLVFYQPILVTTAFLSIKVMPLLPLATFLSLALIPPAMLHFASGALLVDRLGGWVAPASALALLTVGILFSGFIYIAARGWESPLKVALDIVRYLGNPSYRLMIQRALTARLGLALDREQHLVLAGHSLGSIIAIDALINSDRFGSGNSITLITAGSPLVRCFCRFFPGIFFPPSVASIAVAVRRRVKSFTWINIYRPFDFIGASLGLARHGAGRDLSSKQWCKIFTSHSDYWNDPVIIQRVHEMLVEPETTSTVRPGENFYVADVAPNVRSWPLFLKRLRGMSIVMTLVFAAATAGLFQSAKDHRDTEWNSKFAQLKALGIIAAAQGTHWQETRAVYSYGSPAIPQVYVVDHFKLEYSTAEGHPVSAKIQVDPRMLTDVDRRLGIYAFQKFIRENCEYTATPSWFQGKMSVPCRRGNIRVKYLPADPRFFVLPDFPSSSETAGDLVKGTWYVLFSGFACWAAAKSVVVPLLTALLGVGLPVPPVVAVGRAKTGVS